MSDTRRVCFASFEVSPFTAGGIGTWLRNTLDAYAGRDCTLEVLYYGDKKLNSDAFTRRFPRVKLHTVDWADLEEDIFPRNGPKQKASFDNVAQWRSYVLAMTLKKLENETGPFNVIEFSDWGGPSFYTIQEKKLGNAFQETTLAVRLHCTEGRLRAVEHRTWSLENLALMDLETISLRSADIRVAHLEETYKSFAHQYGFGETWTEGKIVQLPPVQVSKLAERTVSIDPNETPLVFTSKLQSVKRPDLFLQGVCEFLGASPVVQSPVIFCASDTDKNLRNRIGTMVPSELKNRVQFLPTLANEEREDLIARSVAVFPSSYEAFCYAAYEASLSGAVVVLNQANPAFGNGTPWQHGINCLKFDGTSDGLARVLGVLYQQAKNGESHSLSPIDIQHPTAPYWETAPKERKESNDKTTKAKSFGDGPKISLIIPHRNEGAALSNTVSALLTEQAVPLEILVIDDASDSEDALHILDTLDEHSSNSGTVLQIRRRHYEGGYAVAVNSQIRNTSADVVCVLCPGDQVVTGFLKCAVAALERNLEYDAIFPALKIVDQSSSEGAALDFMPLGEALTTGLYANRVCNGIFICRRDIIQRNPLDENMTSDWTWDFGMRLVQSGHHILTTAEPIVETPISNIHRQASKSKDQGRENLDTIRRRFFIGGADWRLPLTCVESGDQTSYDWYSEASRRLRQGIPARREGRTELLDPVEELRQLRSATSVRAALAVASQIEALAPWLHTPLRRFLHRRPNA